MPEIHPTAAVCSQARLADDVVVGPNCTIEGEVTLGTGCRLIGHVYLQGPLTVGARNTFYPFTCIGFAPQHRGCDPQQSGAGTVIGDDNVFRESVTIHRASADAPAPATQIGDRNYFMVCAHVGHDSVVGSDCTLANSTLLAGHATVGDHVTMGGNAGLHQFCRIGRLSMIGGILAPRQDVPPFCVVYPPGQVGALNIVGLRRSGLRQHIKPLQRAFAIVFEQRHANRHAADLIDRELGDDALCREFAEFLRTTKRGIMAGTSRRDGRPTKTEA